MLFPSHDKFGLDRKLFDNKKQELDVESSKRKDLLKIQRDQSIEQAKQTRQQDELNRSLELQRAKLEGLLATTSFSETFVAQLKYFQQLKEIDAQDDIKRTRLVDDYKKQSAILRERELIAIKKGATGVDELEAIREERAQLDEGRSRALQDLSAQTNHAKKLAEITLNTGVYQAKFNEEMQRSVSLAETLKNVFGQVGEKIGTLTVSLTEYGQQQKKTADAMASLEEKKTKATELGDKEKIAALDEEIAKQQTKSSEDEVKNSAKVAGSVKNLFKEKTAAHKTFAALEKGYHVARLIMSAKEIAVTIGQTVSFIAQSFGRQGAAAAEAGVLGVKAVINSMSTLPPPFNFAAGAAMTALVASLLASTGQVS